MHLAPAEPCFFLTKRGFINAFFFVLGCDVCSMASCVRAQRERGSAAPVLNLIHVAALLVTCIGFIKIIE